MGLNPQTNRFVSEKEIGKFFIRILADDNWDILILITRKGYWAYKVLVDQETQKRVKSKGKKIYTDRYITKCLDFEEFKEKRVWIYDDTMTHGTTLFFYYSYFQKLGIAVVPIVYGLSTEYPSEISEKFLIREYQRVIRSSENILAESEKEKRAKKSIEEFNKDLRWHVRLSPANISNICVKETQIFQDCLSPLVIDLPILSRMKKDNGVITVPAYINKGESEGITMDMTDFNKVISENRKWEFVDNCFCYKCLKVQCGFFRMKDDILEGKKIPFLHDLIVKCKYRKENDKVKCVFVPFAIFRSMSFGDTIRCFFSLLSDTDYGKEVFDFILQKLNITIDQLKNYSVEELANYPELLTLMEKNHNLCRYMFRSIIFYVSELVGSSFCAYIYSMTGIVLEYDFSFMEESFSKTFIEMFRRSHIGENEYRTTLLSLPEMQEVMPINVCYSDDMQMKWAADNEDKMVEHILVRLIETKNMVQSDIRNRIITIEALEEELSHSFIFKNTEERRQFITKVIIAMLDTSRFGNEIYVDNKEQVIYRGFKYGENSELLFLDGMEYFYTYILAFYCSLGWEKSRKQKAELYKERYTRFVENLELYFKKENYFDSLISGNVFAFLKKYFGQIQDAKLEEQIMNKIFVLNDYWDNENYHGIKSFVDQAFVLVRRWAV